ncbi:hypothetical protein ACJQWK_11638 [Exserohilum turcicum]|uniref:Uncharacterized protein n=1 Tax=Exserohilum turcicum (strain 28A) TaxID=671987 RepID=R0J2E1_EXST2|nr:uncharacterized protein SETTUDRAFT_175005 [Exserohilum turcica Et28A]EOA90931.1 hypothetical protein SETTUDRAFT_175005 [Exserohilum turcica Et28A]
MFGNAWWSALEYGGAFEDPRIQSGAAATAGESIKRSRSTVSTQDENITRPSTAGTQPTGPSIYPPAHVEHEFGFQKRAKGTFLNHTPRDFELRGSKPVMDGQRSQTAARENYSRPRIFGRAKSVNGKMGSRGQQYCCGFLADDDNKAEYHVSVFPVAPVRPKVKDITPPSSPEGCGPSFKLPQRSSSVRLIKALKFESRSGHARREASTKRATSSSIDQDPDIRFQRRQTLLKLTAPSPTIGAQNAELEPQVSKHRREASHDALKRVLPHMEHAQKGEMGIFGLIQEYLHGPGDEPGPTYETSFHAYSTDPEKVVLPQPPESLPCGAAEEEHILAFPAHGLEIPEPSPALPERSPKRLAYSVFPLHVKSALSMDSTNSRTAPAQSLPLQANNVSAPQERLSKRIDVGQAGQVGSPQVGRLAPPILSHDALTASADLGLNDLSFYLKNTGPPPEPKPAVPSRKKSLKMFIRKEKKTDAAQADSKQEGLPRVRRQPSIPACTREMKTAAGARHLRIVVPTDSPRQTQDEFVAAPQPQPQPQPQAQRHTQHYAPANDKEVVHACGDPRVQKITSGHEAHVRSISEPINTPLHTAPRLSSTQPIKEHYSLPVPSKPRPQQATPTLKLRDLERERQKPLPSGYLTTQGTHFESFTGAIATPESLQDPPSSSAAGAAAAAAMETDSGHDEGFVDEDLALKMAKLQRKMGLLQRQNTQLRDALVRIAGLQHKEKLAASAKEMESDERE